MGRGMVRDAHGAWRPGQKGWLGRGADRVLYAVLRVAARWLAKVWFRLRVRGAGNFPATGAFVVAPVHRSNLDTPFTGIACRRRLRFMGKDSLWRSRPGAWFLSALGGFPVHRGSADRDALRRCIEVIEAGEPLVLFPEGSRRTGPIVAELFEGAAYVAAKTGVPVVPVGIGGSEHAMPKGAKFLRPVRVAVVVGAPIQPPPPPVPRPAVHALTERLAVELQKVFDEARVVAGAPG